MTKTITALLAARLCIDGQVSWTEPLDRDQRWNEVTLRDLLRHTTRLPFELHPGHWTGPPLTDSQLSSAVDEPPRLPLPPGTWHYSNLGYAMAGHLLERATGEKFSGLLRRHLLEPLGMGKTSFPEPVTEGRPVLGAGAPAGDLFSTFDDLMVLARAIDGRRPDVVTAKMRAMLLEEVVPSDPGCYLGAGIRTQQVGHHRILVSSGTIRDRTTCLVVWPRRGSSVLVAEAGYSHDVLRDAAIRFWNRDPSSVRTWWWDGQEVVELRYGDDVELRLRETTWPFALFSGRADGRRLVGVDWRCEPMELTQQHGALFGPNLVLTADPRDSAFATWERP